MTTALLWPARCVPCGADRLCSRCWLVRGGCRHDALTPEGLTHGGQ